VVVSIDDHPHAAFARRKGLLVVEARLQGTSDGEGSCDCETRSTDIPYRPPLLTPRPKTNGVESATVVGPPGEEIHTDEFGRVRVHFHWDRESRMDDKSSCWIHVSQPWGGTGYGAMNLPRVGQEVLVDFIGGDPDRPVIVGRVYTNLQKAPYTLPANKTQSGWRSNSTGGTGGYNEIMFEDARGRERVHLQAQKDYAEVIKNNQSSTVLGSRSASVTGDDGMTVGGSQSFSVGHSQSHRIGADQSSTVVGDRASIIGHSDAIDAGDRVSVTVGGGVGYVIASDETIKVTNGKASVVLTPDGLFLDSTVDLVIRANGVLKLCGAEVQIDGGPNVVINSTSKEAASVPKLSKAKEPSKPGKPGSAGELNARGGGGGGGHNGHGPSERTARVESHPVALDQLMEAPPASPAGAPPRLQIGAGVSQAIQEAVGRAGGAMSTLMLVKEQAADGLTLYKLAKGESLASLPSTLDVFGPVMTSVAPSLSGMVPQALGEMVNAGNMAGIVHTGSTGSAVTQFMALRTATAPPSVNGIVAQAEAQRLEAQGMAQDAAYARALSGQGVALYRGDPEGMFTKVDLYGDGDQRYAALREP
jgi:type VI secretion system secreted protein VgrG